MRRFTTFFKLAALEVPKGKETYQQDPVHCPQWGWLDSHSDHSAFAKAEAGEDFSGASENPYGIHMFLFAYIFLAKKKATCFEEKTPICLLQSTGFFWGGSCDNI